MVKEEVSANRMALMGALPPLGACHETWGWDEVRLVATTRLVLTKIVLV